MNNTNGAGQPSNDNGQPMTTTSSSSQPQQVMSGSIAQQQASQIHAAQLLQQQHQRMQQQGAVQYVAYPTMIPLPNGGAYSIIQPSPATSMGQLQHQHHQQPPGQMVAYPNGQVAYHLSPALLNAHASLYPRIPGMIQTQQQQMHMPPGMVQSSPNLCVQPQQMISASQWPQATTTMLEQAKREVQKAPVRRKPYRDFAKDPESNVPSTNQRSNKDQTFPVILYRILSNSECKDYISWLPHGRAFRIHKPDDVEENVLPLYFRHTKFASFMRQVNGWGFRRMPTGPDRNAYYHEMFLRGFPYLCAKMRRPIHKIKSSSEPKTHPNFYDNKSLVALPNEERVVTSESTSPTNISSDSANPDTDGSGSDQTPSMFRSSSGNPNSFPEYGMSNLYNSSGGEDSSRLGGNLYGSVNGSDNSNPYASGSSEQGCGSENGSNGGDGGERGNLPPIHNINGHTSGGIGSFDPSAAYASSSRPSGSSDSGEGGTTSDGSSSGAARKGEPSSQSNGKTSDTPSSNGNSSDGSGSGSFLHLLTDTSLRAAALSAPHHQQGGSGAPAFVGGYGGGARDNISILGSDTGTEPVSDVSFSRWANSPRKRAHARLVVARKMNAVNNNAQQQGESSDGSSSDDRGGR